MTYETRASDRPETFEQDSLEWADDGIVIYEQHNPHGSDCPGNPVCGGP